MMKADFFYSNAPGRFVLKTIQKTGAFRLGARFLAAGASKPMIRRYIRKNSIDMTPYQGQEYSSFADFFARKKGAVPFDRDPSSLISPCDGLLSVYPVTQDLVVPMKGSRYRLQDLLPEDDALLFQDGICLVFRLEASDYHHFCCFDDGVLIKTRYIPGALHSVQPIALDRYPVFRLNRRWASLLETKHFGKAEQVEVGAMMVGGISFAVKEGAFHRGDEMGNFELAGSTILLFLTSKTGKHLKFSDEISSALEQNTEVRVRIGKKIGALQDEK